MDPPPPPRGRDQPQRGQVDKEAASIPHNPPPPLEPRGQPGFQAPPMPQLEFSLP